MLKRMMIFMVFAFIGLGLAACEKEDFLPNAYRTLVVTRASYDTLMNMTVDAYRGGLIDVDTKDKIVDVGLIYYGSHKGAVAALEAYNSAIKAGGDTATLKELAIVAVSSAVGKMSTFIKAYNEVAKGVKGMTTWEFDPDAPQPAP